MSAAKANKEQYMDTNELSDSSDDSFSDFSDFDFDPNNLRLVPVPLEETISHGSTNITSKKNDTLDEIVGSLEALNHMSKEILNLNVKSCELMKMYSERQTELVDQVKRLREQLNVRQETHDESDGRGSQQLDLDPKVRRKLLNSKRASAVVTRTCYQLWGVRELSRRAVRPTHLMPHKRALSPEKKELVREVYCEWMVRRNYTPQKIDEELKPAKFHKYLNGAITAAVKKSLNNDDSE